MATWPEDIKTALGNLGGTAHLSDIYKEIQKIRPLLPNTWKASVRKNLELHSPDSEAYAGGEKAFQTVLGLGKGVWQLRKFRKNANNIPQDWEIALIKSFLLNDDISEQAILAYFTHPSRSINHRCIGEIRRGKRGAEIKPADKERLVQFKASWPHIDPDTGFSLYLEQRLVKAREAMINAIQSYNNPSHKFKAEQFIVLAVIAWTYLLHEILDRKGVVFKFKQKDEERYWELSKCLKRDESPLTNTQKLNLDYLIEIRHEIEHRMTNRIDETIAPMLLSCAQNFNDVLVGQFGTQWTLEQELTIALPFSDKGPKAVTDILSEKGLAEFNTKFFAKMSEEEFNDPEFAIRFFFVPKTVNKKSQAQKVVEFIGRNDASTQEVNQLILKEVEKVKLKPTQIVQRIQEAGFPKFNMHHHTTLWKKLDARQKHLGYGVEMADGQWYWYQRWYEEVLRHCQENTENYQ